MSNAKLIIRSSGQPDQEITISGITSIGRAFDNSVCIPSPGLSRYHAVVEQRPDGYWVSDLKSRNGTLVNGRAVTSECKLEDGDSVSLGQATTVEFHLNEAPADSRSASAKAPPSSAEAQEKQSIEGLPATTARAEPAARSSRPAAMIGLAIIAAVGLFLIAALLLMSSRAGRSPAPSVTAGGQDVMGRSEPPPPAKTGAGGTPEEPPPPPDGREGGDKSGTGQQPGLVRVQSMAVSLAGQLSERSGYVFAPQFVEQISRSAKDYQIDVIKDAQSYSHDINAAFGNKGMSSILGFILAMSQSKFRPLSGAAERGGLWQVPFAIAQQQGYVKEGETEAALRDPKRSAEIAAAYMKELLDQFGGKENFMYAIACYGEPRRKAGEMRSRLDEKDPDRTARLNFWRMVDLGVVSPDAAARVVRFFAAGIVGENPEQFGLRTQRLSELIS